MVNTTGGSKHKKQKKHRVVPDQTTDNQILLADTNQIYALVKKKTGGSRVTVECSDNKERSAIIPGRFFKKLWFNPGDILLCSLEPNGDDSLCYIEHKYSVKDANTLKFQGKMSFEVAVVEKQENKGFKFVEGSKLKNNNDNINISESLSESSDDFGIMSNPNKQTKLSGGKKKSQSKSCKKNSESLSDS